MINREVVNSQEKGFNYSNKLLGRLKNAYDSCQLTLVGGDFNGQKAKSRHFSGPPILSEDEIGDIPAFNVRLPQVTERMFLVGGSTLEQESYITGLGGSDFQNLPEIATQVALGRRPSTVIRLVYGATKEMPFRALSYLLPALIYMEHNKDFISQLQVVFVNNLSSRLDRLDTSSVREQSMGFAGIAQAYIRNFFPDSDSKTVFLEDTPLDKDSDFRDRLLTLSTTLKKVAPEDILDNLVRKATNHGSRRTYAFYGAAHTLIHDIDIPDVLRSLLPDQPQVVSNPDVIVSIGGKKEEVFYRLRHAIKPYLNPEYKRAKTLQFFTRHNVPPYYMARDGDIALKEVIVDSTSFMRLGIDSAAERDIDYLRKVSSTRGDLLDFFAGIGRSKYE